MRNFPPRRKSQGRKTLYCIYCNEELGADPSHCIYCGASLSNPLAATSTVRRDVPNPFVWFAPKPISNRRKAFSLILGLAGPWLSDRRVYFGFHISILLAGACVCALLIALGMAWARRENRVQWPDFFSVAEKLIFASVAIEAWIGLGQPRVSDVTTCYGACAASVAGVSAFVLVAAGVAVLAVLIVVALLLVTHARSGSRLTAARGQARVTHLPGSDRWGVTSREPVARLTRRL